jgi:hypothetical protein
MLLKTIASIPQPPADNELIRKAEQRFFWFVIIYWSLAIFLPFVVDFFSPAISELVWEHNILWNGGSILILFSVLHTRYFDIKKNCNPENRHFRGSDFNPYYHFGEKIALHSWTLGFVLMALSRWIQL